jgi:cell division protein ZapA (FtsZ GTPase activity inhibitor)
MIQVDVSIMGQAYRLACKEGEEATLQQAVAYLDKKMCAIRDSGKIKGNDRIAVMAALGIAAELAHCPYNRLRRRCCRMVRKERSTPFGVHGYPIGRRS